MRIRRILLAFPLLAAALPAQDRATVVNAGREWSSGNKILIRGQTIEIDPAQVKPQLTGDKSGGELLLDCPGVWSNMFATTNAAFPPAPINFTPRMRR